jgi:hypothetical protein
MNVKRRHFSSTMHRIKVKERHSGGAFLVLATGRFAPLDLRIFASLHPP